MAANECIAGREKIGYRLFRFEKLDAGLSEIGVCVLCKNPLTLDETFTNRKGLVSKMSIVCSNSACSKSVVVSDPTSSEDCRLNDAAILGARMSGCGLSVMEELSACIGMLPPLTRPMWTQHNKHISEIAGKVAKQCRLDAAKHLHEKMGKPLDEVIDVIVTVDGTWQKRGRISLFGVVVVIAWLTGQVLDVEVLSKHCGACKMHEHLSSDEFEEWYADHEEDCECNYKGSSNAMEIEGVKRIWVRSVYDLKLRYTTYIGDGDVKTFAILTELQPYGPNVTIIKHECVGHVQKRLGTALRNLKKSGALGDDGRPVKFKGRLTNDAIKALNVYYGGAIRDSGGSVDAMVKAIDASFLHSISTDDHPCHVKCPEHKPPDQISWCKFRIAEFEGKPKPKHKPLIPRDLDKYVRPVYQRLANRDLLERCTLGATQNQNESFNNLIWLRASKTQMLSATNVELAVNIAVLVYNKGKELAMKDMLLVLGLQQTQRASEYYKKADRLRLYKSEKRASAVEKRRRRRKNRNRAAAEESAIAQEGPTYGSGEF